MKKYYIICMGFNGEYQEERPRFKTILEAWDYSNTLGSKWYFYPYSFVCSGKTVIEYGYGLTHLKNKRIKTVSKHFKEITEDPANEGLNAEEFWFKL